MDQRKRRQPLAVGKTKVQQEHVDAAIGQAGQAVRETVHPLYPIAWVRGLLQGFLNQPRVAGVILDDQDADASTGSLDRSLAISN